MAANEVFQNIESIFPRCDFFKKSHNSFIAYQTTGMGGFYRGIDANVMRAMVLNGTKMGCYDQIKGMIEKSGAVPKGKLILFFLLKRDFRHCFEQLPFGIFFFFFCATRMNIYYYF